MAGYSYTRILSQLSPHTEWILSASEVYPGTVPRGDWVRYPDLSAKDTSYSKTHTDGWTIEGQIHNDWYSWVVDFEAVHPVHGTIQRVGNTIVGPSKEVVDKFLADHRLEEFDYWDI
jgi:hypothetical protein